MEMRNGNVVRRMIVVRTCDLLLDYVPCFNLNVSLVFKQSGEQISQILTSVNLQII